MLEMGLRAMRCLTAACLSPSGKERLQGENKSIDVNAKSAEYAENRRGWMRSNRRWPMKNFAARKTWTRPLRPFAPSAASASGAWQRRCPLFRFRRAGTRSNAHALAPRCQV